MQIFINLLLVFIATILLAFGAIFLILTMAFSRRFDPHPRLKYFTIEDFPGVDVDWVTLPNRTGQQLKGGFYYDDRVPAKNKLIIFAHGVGAGHEAYTHFLMHFVQQGYVVFAFDYTGCGRSEGKAVGGIPKASQDLVDVLQYLQKTTYAALPWILIGHSWGAYNVLTLTNATQHPLAATISIAPFNDVAEMLAVYLPWLRAFKPLVNASIALKFGLQAARSTASRLKATQVQTLLIAGEKDDEITLRGNYEVFVEAANHNPKVKVYLAKGHRHNPYLSFRAETYVIDTILNGTKAMAKEKDAVKVDDFFKNLDYAFVGEHDPQILALISKFIA